MELEQLTTALAAHDPDPDAVLAALRVKQRRRARNRGLVLGGGLAAAVVVLVAVVLQPSPSSPSSPGPVVTNPPQGATGCGVISLRDTLTMARQGGASVIVATGSLTGTTTLGTQLYHQMILRSVRTLSGPAVASGSTAWVASRTGPTGPIPGADAGSLWATDGSLFAIVWPAQQAGTKVGPVLRVAPVVGDQVILSSAGCWNAAGLPTQPYHGQLAETPGSDSYQRAAASGFSAVPLTAVEQLLGG